jgi:hypothetical protein
MPEGIQTKAAEATMNEEGPRLFFHQNDSDNDTERRVKYVHIIHAPV